jgi:hypothetical protein
MTPSREDLKALLLSTIKTKVTVSRTGKYEEEYPFEVAGESKCWQAIKAIADTHPDRGPVENSAECKVTASLIPEGGGAVGAQAIRVEIQGSKVGYLDPNNESFYPRAYRRLVSMAPLDLDALIIGGWYRGPGDWGHLGVRLRFDVSEDRASS